jgi:hypothetical protein
VLQISLKDFAYVDEEASEVVGLYTDEENDNIEWTHGYYNKEEYDNALQRSESDLYYNPALGMKYSKVRGWDSCFLKALPV